MKNYCIITTIDMTMSAFIIEAARYHQRKGFNVTLICSMSDIFYDAYKEEFDCINLNMSRGTSLLEVFKVSYKLYKIFRNKKFDIVQYATPNAAFYSSIASRCANVPNRLYCQWGIRYVGFYGVKRALFKLVEKITCKLSTHICSASEKNRQFAISESLYSCDKSGIIGKGGTIGVNLKEFDLNNKIKYRNEVLADLEIPKENFIFGYVGSLRKDKGTNELLRAFKNLSENHSNINLLLVGSFFEGDPIESELLNWAKSSEFVSFLGTKKHTSLFISSFDVHVHPSYREGFSMVIQEAMALKVPVITTNIPGPSEVVENGISGILVEPHNIAQLEKAMESLYNNRDLSKELSQKAYQRCLLYFNRDEMLRLTHEDRMRILASKKGN